MMYGKGIWKPGIGEIVKASRDFAPEPHKGGLQHPLKPSSCRGQHVEARWIMAYGHKTQSFLRNVGQQKCLDKALQTETDLLNRPGT